MRGGGNVLGDRQSGAYETLNRYADEVLIDRALISEAKLIADGVKIDQNAEDFFKSINYQKYYNVIKDSVLN